MKSTLRLSEKDNVAVALKALSPGDAIQEKSVIRGVVIPPGHKVALDRTEANR